MTPVSSGTAVSRDARTRGSTGSANRRATRTAQLTMPGGAGTACRRRCRAAWKARRSPAACRTATTSHSASSAMGHNEAYGMATGTRSGMAAGLRRDASRTRSSGAGSTIGLADVVGDHVAVGSQASGSAGMPRRLSISFRETSHQSHARTAGGMVGRLRQRPQTTPATTVASSEARPIVPSRARLPARRASSTRTSVMTTASLASGGARPVLRVRSTARV